MFLEIIHLKNFHLPETTLFQVANGLKITSLDQLQLIHEDYIKYPSVGTFTLNTRFCCRIWIC